MELHKNSAFNLYFDLTVGRYCEAYFESQSFQNYYNQIIIKNSIDYSEYETQISNFEFWSCSLCTGKVCSNSYNDKTWLYLPVKLLCEDNKYLYFTAKTPKFSFFAIAGKAIENEKITETKPATDAQNLDKNSTASEVGNKSEQGKLTSIPGFGTVCGIICLITVLLYKRKQDSQNIGV